MLLSRLNLEVGRLILGYWGLFGQLLGSLRYLGVQVPLKRE